MFSKTTFIGLALVVTGLALPVIGYVGGRIYLADVASYGGPPNQGAMFLAYQALQILVFVGGCLASGGLVMSIMSLRKATPRPTLHANRATYIEPAHSPAP